MARNPEFLKHFEDVNLDALGFGGLGGLGSAHHVKTNAKPTREGVKMSVNCDHCGAPNIILVEWPEAVIISQGRMPGGWKYIQGYVQPQIGCNQCQKVSAPGVGLNWTALLHSLARLTVSVVLPVMALTVMV